MIDRLVKIVFLIAGLVSFSNSVSSLPNSPVEEIFYEDQLIKLERHPKTEVFADKFVISYKGKNIFDSEGAIELYQGYNVEKIYSLKEINSPIIIVKTYSGGAHCCFNTDILDMKHKSKLGHFNGWYSPVEIRTLSNERGFKIKLQDWTYAYRWTSFSESYAPEIILNLKKGKISMAFSEMQHSALDTNQLKDLIVSINQGNYKYFKYSYMKNRDLLSSKEMQDNDNYFGKLLKAVLNLIYSGNARQARIVIDKTWPRDEKSKCKFLEDLQQSLQESEYWAEIEKINNGKGIIS